MGANLGMITPVDNGGFQPVAIPSQLINELIQPPTATQNNNTTSKTSVKTVKPVTDPANLTTGTPGPINQPVSTAAQGSPDSGSTNPKQQNSNVLFTIPFGKHTIPVTKKTAIIGGISLATLIGILIYKG